MRIYYYIASLLLFASCNKLSHNNKNIVDQLPHEMLLNIPTYDGSGQAVHPDILYLDPPLRGNSFLLAFTPYPNSNARVENPSILASKNGVDFSEEEKGLNPLEPAPSYDHNDDPDILYDPERKLYIFRYLETMRPDSENVIQLESKDALTWTRHTALHYDLHDGNRFIVSPTTCRLHEGGYVMYHVNLSATPFQLEWLTSSDGIIWNKNIINTISSDLNDTLVPWHVDVFNAGNIYYMLLSCRTHITDPNHQKLMLGESSDLINWHFHSRPLNETDISFHNCLSMYRSSGLISGRKLAVWYSMVNMAGQWRIGVEKFDMGTL